MIVDFWPTWFRAHLFEDGGWPRSYCAVDVETSGFSFAQDVVTEWGHVLVEDGEVVDRLSLVIDWTGRHEPADFWLRNQLAKVKQGMEFRGKACHMSYDLMKSSGMKPEKAFAFIKQFTDTIKKQGLPFVFHNGTFDEKMLAANFRAYGFGSGPAQGFSFGQKIIDTAAVEKASQIPDNARVHPKKTDTPREYFTRVMYTRVTGVQSNLDEHCATKYSFREKYGVTAADMHKADADAYCCHLLMQEYGALVSTEPKIPPVYPTADSMAARKPPPRVTTPRAVVSATQTATRVRGQRRS